MMLEWITVNTHEIDESGERFPSKLNSSKLWDMLTRIRQSREKYQPEMSLTSCLEQLLKDISIPNLSIPPIPDRQITTTASSNTVLQTPVLQTNDNINRIVGTTSSIPHSARKRSFNLVNDSDEDFCDCNDTEENVINSNEGSENV